MKKTAIFIIVFLFVGIIAFCAFREYELKRVRSELNNQEKYLANLEKDIVALKQIYDEKKIKNIATFEVLSHEVVEHSESTAIHVDSKNYAIVKTNITPLCVSVDDVQPHLNGYRLSLSIGNPALATYNGFTLKAYWFDSANKKIKDITSEYSEKLNAGRWSIVDVDITPMTVDELKNLRIGIQLSNLTLLKE